MARVCAGSGDLRPRRSGPTARAIAARSPRRAGDSAWAPDWLRADRAAAEAMDAWLAALDEPFEGAPFPALAAALPDGSTLWAGNSMPVRDMDGWLPVDRARDHGPLEPRRERHRRRRVDGARVGRASARRPVALVVGDLSFLHDLNALVAAKLHGLSATIVLVNNDGGGIFSFLPQALPPIPGAGLPDRYEELFGTPHGIDVGPIVTALGGEHVVVGPADLRAQVERSIGLPGRAGARAAHRSRAQRRAPPRGRRGRRGGDPADEPAGRRRPPLGGPGARRGDGRCC